MSENKVTPFGERTHAPHIPTREGLDVQVLEVGRDYAHMSQQPMGPDGCVACNGRWEGFVIADYRGRMWHVDCLQAVAAQFVRINKVGTMTPEKAREAGYVYDGCGKVFPEPNEVTGLERIRMDQVAAEIRLADLARRLDDHETRLAAHDQRAEEHEKLVRTMEAKMGGHQDETSV